MPGAALIGYVGAASVIGRLGLSAVAPRFGLLTMYQIAYVVLVLSYGLCADRPFICVACVAALLFSVEGLGELLGILFTGFGVAGLLGPTTAGVLVDHTHGYRAPVFVAAAAAVAAMAVVIPLAG